MKCSQYLSCNVNKLLWSCIPTALSNKKGHPGTSTESIFFILGLLWLKIDIHSYHWKYMRHLSVLLNGVTRCTLEKQQRTCLLFLHEQLLAIQMSTIHYVRFSTPICASLYVLLYINHQTTVCTGWIWIECNYSQLELT